MLHSSCSFVVKTMVLTALTLTGPLQAVEFNKNINKNVLDKPKAEVKKVKVGDVELAYSIRGDGEPLVLIAGFKSTMSIWDPALLDLLEKDYQVITFDNRGVGLSTDSAEDKTTIPQMADDAAGLIEALGIDKAHVIGWSMGGAIAETLAIRHPDRVQKVILCSPTPTGKDKTSPSEEVVKTLTSPTAGVDGLMHIFFPNNEEGTVFAKAYLNRLSEAFKDGTMPDDKVITPQTVERQTNARRLFTSDTSVFDDLKKIKAPVLVVGGLQDVIDPPQNAHLIAGQIPFAWLAYMEGGHAFMFQDHERFASLVLVFLQ